MVDRLCNHPIHFNIIKKDVGFYLFERARTWVNIVSFVPCSPLILDPQLGAPYPRSAGFDTDIGAFIESSVVLSTEGSMARLVIDDSAVSGETFLPGQLFVFGGFALRADLVGHLEQIDSYAPGH